MFDDNMYIIYANIIIYRNFAKYVTTIGANIGLYGVIVNYVVCIYISSFITSFKLSNRNLLQINCPIIINIYAIFTDLVLLLDYRL